MKLDGKKVMVTGAAGFIGSPVAERLAARCELVLLDDTVLLDELILAEQQCGLLI